MRKEGNGVRKGKEEKERKGEIGKGTGRISEMWKKDEKKGKKERRKRWKERERGEKRRREREEGKENGKKERKEKRNGKNCGNEGGKKILLEKEEKEKEKLGKLGRKEEGGNKISERWVSGGEREREREKERRILR